MFKKVLDWVKSSGAKLLINELSLATPYLVDALGKVQGKIGNTPQDQANWIVKTVQDYLTSKLPK